MAQQYIRVIYHTDKIIDQLKALDINPNVRDQLINETDEFLTVANGKYDNPDPNKNLNYYLEQIHIILVKSAVQENNRLKFFRNAFFFELAVAGIAVSIMGIALMICTGFIALGFCLTVGALITGLFVCFPTSQSGTNLPKRMDEESASFEKKIEKQSTAYTAYSTFFNKEGMTIERVGSVDTPVVSLSI